LPALLTLTLLLLVSPAAAIDLTPQPIPGMENAVNMFLGWIYWLALMVCVAVIIAGVIFLFRGDRDTRSWIVLGLIALAFLLALPQILSAIGL